MNRGLFRLILLLFPMTVFPRSYEVHAFRGYNSFGMQKMQLIGQVISKTMSNEGKNVRLLNYDTRQMVITARIYEWKGLRLGDKIYILEKDPDHNHFKNALIVAEAEVYSLFRTEFQGWMLKAKGNLSMVKEGHFIAREYNPAKKQQALISLKRGETFLASGNESRAYQEFRKSLEADSGYPEIWFKLAKLARKRGLREEEGAYLEGAWKLFSRFEDANALISLPGEYLRWHFENRLAPASSSKEKLSHSLKLLDRIHHFRQKLDWFKTSFSEPILRMLEKKGLPDRVFQLYIGKIYYEIARTLEKNSLEWTLANLSRKEREILYRPIYLPYTTSKFEYPKKSWNLAFLRAALYHLQLAAELDPLETGASYEIVRVTYTELLKKPSQKRREQYMALLDHYSRQFLRVPSEPARMAFVRKARKQLSQL